MTVIVWDGETLATDKAATDGAAKWEAVKAWHHHDAFKGPLILSGAGPLQTILTMRNWVLDGALQNKFPSVQLTPQFCHFVVISRTGLIRYEQGPIPIDHGRDKCAFGEGKDFAYGAMAMGATAFQAVEIANRYSSCCGLGVATYALLK